VNLWRIFYGKAAKNRAIRSNLFCPPQAAKKGFPLYPLRPGGLGYGRSGDLGRFAQMAEDTTQYVYKNILFAGSVTYSKTQSL
jgi:hypothetical protein